LAAATRGFAAHRARLEARRPPQQPDGSAEATFSVCHTAELEQYVLRAGGRVQVISPANVRDRVRTAAERLAAGHAAGGEKPEARG
jgi:predicted DNA-binding transcriptional regulator YafY